MNSRFRLILTLAFVAPFLCATQASAIPLSDLIFNGQSITVGDKLFDNWLFDTNNISNLLGPRNQFNLANIDVTGNNSNPSNPTLTFTALTADGMTITQASNSPASGNLTFGFDVTVLDPYQRWNDLELVATFNESPNTPSTDNRNAEITLLPFGDAGLLAPPVSSLLDRHLIRDDNANTVVNDSGVPVHTFLNNPLSNGFALVALDLNTQFLGESVGLDEFTIGFSQVAVPEPSTWALTSLGVLGFVGHGRRKRRQAAEKKA